MIKELLLAIALGAFLGFGITGGFFALNKNRTASVATNNELATPTTAPEPTAAELKTIDATDSAKKNQVSTGDSKIIISSPENQSVVSNSKITLNGTASPKSTIIISTLEKDYNTTSDEAGNFSLNIELDSGVNVINIISIDSQDKQTETQVEVTYSTAKF